MSPVLSLAVILGFVIGAAGLAAEYADANEGALWAAYKVEYARQYSDAEDSRRRRVFAENMRRAAVLEASSKTGATFGPNPFFDMTPEEFARMRLTLRAPNVTYALRNSTASGAPPSKDWRLGGVVTPVKDQAGCGACWAFAATGSIEARHALATGSLVPLSEQELISCDTTASGCDGGQVDVAFQWLIDRRNGRIVTEASYPFVSGAEPSRIYPCKDSTKLPTGATIKSYAALPADEAQLAAYLVAHGPFAAAVDASSWMTYRGGVMDACTAFGVNHAVLIVGISSQGWWIVKNAWGTRWGEAGYIRLQYGTNQCLIQSFAVAPQL
eukprot:TRINITY_DN3583_c0_g2_i1.p1 TRINITY_DN3583_c0_g2~~TRINITY_DN3583_c0_g2_i1.p1  ORF type:complete len:327 (+),score=51.23 TRINITY_DN3583_c0_g2_i1:48-1028(+)